MSLVPGKLLGTPRKRRRLALASSDCAKIIDAVRGRLRLRLRVRVASDGVRFVFRSEFRNILLSESKMDPALPSYDPDKLKTADSGRASHVAPECRHAVRCFLLRSIRLSELYK